MSKSTPKPCTVPHCDRELKTQGMCNLHYQRVLRCGTTELPQRPPKPTTCSLDGCDRGGNLTRGMCQTHGGRVRRLGSTELPAKRLLNPCRADDCDADENTRGLCGRHYQRHVKYGTTVLPARVPKAKEWRGCSIPECPSEHRARGLCFKHYSRQKATGTTDLRERTPAPKKPCAIPGCDTDAIARGWCSLHYSRWSNKGDVFWEPVALPGVCSIDDCDGPAGTAGTGRGYCKMHYARWYSHGDPLVKLIRTDYDPVCTADGCDRPHISGGLCGTHYSAHRIRNQPICTEADCDKNQQAKGLCPMHYARSKIPPPTYECVTCHETFAGRRSNSYCDPCRPGPAELALLRKERLARNNAPLTEADQMLAREYRVVLAGDPCCYCGAAFGAIDHINPVVLGGWDRWDNYTAACRRCNSVKRDRPLLRFLLSRMSPDDGLGEVDVESGRVASFAEAS